MKERDELHRKVMEVDKLLRAIRLAQAQRDVIIALSDKEQHGD